MQTEERLCGRVLVLRYDARGRLTTVKIRGVTKPWVELDPSVPRGEVHFGHFGDTSAWRGGIHYETTGGPWESEHETRKPYEQFVAEELEAMRLRLVASVEAASLPWMREVVAYVRKHRLVGPRCHTRDPALDALVRAYAARVKGKELAELRAALDEMGAGRILSARASKSP